jgi:hypothetical protein
MNAKHVILAVSVLAIMAFAASIEVYNAPDAAPQVPEVKELPGTDAFSVSDSNSRAYVSNRKDSDGISFSNFFCTEIKRANGEIAYSKCDHNMQVTQGKTIVRDLLLGNGGNLKIMGFGNGSAPVAGDVALNNEIPTVCGFSRAAGTVVYTNTTAYTVQRVITSTCDNQVVNTTGLYNTTTGNFLAFGGVITSPPTLMSGDTLTQNYTVVNN